MTLVHHFLLNVRDGPYPLEQSRNEDLRHALRERNKKARQALARRGVVPPFDHYWAR
jgi:hypothetical protein